MKTSAEVMFGNLDRLYKNIYNLLYAFQEANKNNTSTITVEQYNLDGTTEKIEIKSFSNIMSELSRLDNNFRNLINEDGNSYFLSSDGDIQKYYKTTFLNTEFIKNIEFGSEAITEYNSMVHNLVFPNVKLPISLDTEIKTDVNTKVFTILSGWENIPESIDLIGLNVLINQGSVIAERYDETLPLVKQQVEYYGEFDVIDIKLVDDITANVKLNKLTFSGINIGNDSIDLSVNDILANSGTKYSIESIDRINNIVSLRRVAGVGNLKVGLNQLSYNQVITTDTNIVNIPIKANTRMIVFLSPENINFIGYPSKGIKIDTDTFTIKYNNQEITLDEFFDNYVTNVAEYITSLVKESTIPVSLGIKPTQTTLLSSNFKVMQINKHLTDAKSTKDLENLNNKKQVIKNDIEYKQIESVKIQNELDTLKYKSSEEKKFRIETLATIQQEIITLNQQLLTVTRDINNNAISYGLKDTKPKYRVIGAWELISAMYSPSTKPQQIIKYEVQYRYLSKNVDTVDSTTYKMITTDGREINIVVSPWNVVDTRTLTKVINPDGTLTWESPILESADDVNINQVAIPINEGESVEIRVRAISEAGYPISPMKADWSNILRVDFPNSLTEAALSTIVAKNEQDLATSEFNNILFNSGVLTHIQNEFRENEKTFFHKADDIASGFYTAEQKTIPLGVFLQTLRNDFDSFVKQQTNEKITIELVDFNNEVYTVSNNTTIELFAGNYSDTINLLDNEKYGSIIRKQGYIKIKNGNNIPVEVKSLVPGTEINQVTANHYYNTPIKNVDSFKQKSKQIFYFRNVDITGQPDDAFKLVVPKPYLNDTEVNPIYFDETVAESERNIAYLNGDNVKTCKLFDNAGSDFIAFTKEHPLFSNNQTEFKAEFNRLKTYTANLKAENYQDELSFNGTELTTGLGFNNYDLYSVGENTCGAFFYPVISNVTNVSVVGNNSISVLIVPANSEILVPIIYEYRMTDRLGRVNGRTDTTINDELIYTKKLGIDLLLNNNLFKFDILVSSRLKSTLTSMDSVNVSSVASLYNNESDEILS